MKKVIDAVEQYHRYDTYGDLPKRFRDNLVGLLRQLANDIESGEGEVTEFMVEYPDNGAKFVVQVKYPKT